MDQAPVCAVPNKNLQSKGEMMFKFCKGYVGKIALGAAAATLVLSSEQSFAQPPAAKPHASKALPDWSGVWEPIGGFILDVTAQQRPENKGNPPYEVRDFPPYNPDYEARYDNDIAALRKGASLSDLSAQCLPVGMPRIMAIPYPTEFIIQPKRVIVMFELSGPRMIYTDGRQHSAPDDLDPTFNGESIGHWEGDVLVIDTIGIRSDVIFDVSGAMHSDALHIKERVRRISHDIIQDDMVLEDPKAFTRPWQVRRQLRLHPGWQMSEYVCENNRSPTVGANAAK